MRTGLGSKISTGFKSLTTSLKDMTTEKHLSESGSPKPNEDRRESEGMEVHVEFKGFGLSFINNLPLLLL